MEPLARVYEIIKERHRPKSPTPKKTKLKRKPCPPGYHRSSKTKRCKKNKTVRKVKVSSPGRPFSPPGLLEIQDVYGEEGRTPRLSPALKAEAARRKQNLLQRIDWTDEDDSDAVKRRISAAIRAEQGYSRTPSPRRSPPRRKTPSPPRPRAKYLWEEEDLSVDDILALMDTPEKTPPGIDLSSPRKKSRSPSPKENVSVAGKRRRESPSPTLSVSKRHRPSSRTPLRSSLRPIQVN